MHFTTLAFVLASAIHPSGFTVLLMLGMGLLKLCQLMVGGTIVAQPAINTFLQLGNGQSPETFTTVANVGTITGPGLSLNVVDVTSHSTGVPWRQKIGTLL